MGKSDLSIGIIIVSFDHNLTLEKGIKGLTALINDVAPGAITQAEIKTLVSNLSI